MKPECALYTFIFVFFEINELLLEKVCHNQRVKILDQVIYHLNVLSIISQYLTE